MRISLTILSFAFAAFLSAQITVNKHLIDFGDVTQGSPVRDSVLITNDYDIKTGINFMFFDESFSIPNEVFTLAGKTSRYLVITFDPKHNIDYNSELIVLTSSQGNNAIRVDLRGKGYYPGSYYTKTRNLYHEDLKAELKSIISSGYRNLGYSGARDKMYGDIDNQSGQVECVYTGRKATFNTRSGANSNSFNCEHTWPQSLFNSDEPERADIHHLFPTDVSANSQRGNLPFGEVSSSSWSQGGSKKGSSAFEPRNIHKGDVARAMFYFSVRYGNYSSFLTGQESILRSWSVTDAPSTWEITRNEKIYGYQKNRNPFVDHPEFLERIASISKSETPDPQTSFEFSNSQIGLRPFPSSDTSVYQFMMINTGQTAIAVDSVSSSRDEFVVENGTFVLQPGEAHAIRIHLRAAGNLGRIIGNIVVHTADKSLERKINVTGEITSLSFNEVRSEISIQAYGNHINLSTDDIGQLSIYTLTGRLVRFTEITSSFTDIDLGYLSPSTYFAVFNSKFGIQRVLKFQVVAD